MYFLTPRQRPVRRAILSPPSRLVQFPCPENGHSHAIFGETGASNSCSRRWSLPSIAPHLDGLVSGEIPATVARASGMPPIITDIPNWEGGDPVAGQPHVRSSFPGRNLAWRNWRSDHSRTRRSIAGSDTGPGTRKNVCHRWRGVVV